MAEKQKGPTTLDVGNSMGDLIYIVDAEGRILDVNNMGKKILGLSKEEMIGKTIDDLWDMGAFVKDYNFFIGYDETKA